MAGTVYLRTDRFEVKLEGITFKIKDFESLCKMGFLFPDGKIWANRPIVGLDVMYHPRDPSIILLLLCFGLGCVILRFGAGEALPAGIHKFLADKRIHVVGFGIPEKFDLFPFEELGLSKNESDIGYLAAKSLKNPKYKRSGLDELARKVLGIKRMIGLTESSSFERHEQIKCAICQLFVTTVVAMGLSGANDKNKLDDPSKKSTFLKNLSSLHLLAEGWFKLPKVRQRKQMPFDNNNNSTNNNIFDKNALGDCQDGRIVDVLVNAEIPERGDFASPKSDTTFNLLEKEKTGSGSNSIDDYGKKPIKGILKCPSTTLHRNDSSSFETSTPPSPSTATPSSPFTATPPSPSTPTGPRGNKDMLKRANSKGHNVSFKFH